MLLDEYSEVPYKVINFLGAEINYGGRVTDDKDVRLIKTILKLYMCRDVNLSLNKNFRLFVMVINILNLEHTIQSHLELLMTILSIYKTYP